MGGDTVFQFNVFAEIILVNFSKSGDFHPVLRPFFHMHINLIKRYLNPIRIKL